MSSNNPERTGVGNQATIALRYSHKAAIYSRPDRSALYTTTRLAGIASISQMPATMQYTEYYARKKEERWTTTRAAGNTKLTGKQRRTTLSKTARLKIKKCS